MRKHGIISLIISLTSIGLMFFSSCGNIKQITQALTNLKRLEFKLNNIKNFKLNDIAISNKKDISDFSITDGKKLIQIFSANKFPAEFVLNVTVINPNDGTGGSRQTTSTIEKLDWILYIDNKLTVSGEIEKQVDIPGTGQTSIIPINIKLDLFEFFGDKGYNDVINLAFALGGVKGSTARVKLDIKPIVSTPLGAIVYPGWLTIIDKEFSGN